MKKVLASVVAASLALATVGCAAQSNSADQAATDDTAAVEDGQNPVMNFIGTYAAGRATITVACQGASDALITVDWGTSASESSTWTMSGTLDTETLTVDYTNGTKTDIVWAEDGTGEETVVYTDGTGSFTFEEYGGLTWNDEKEHVADGTTFEYTSYAPED